MPLVLQYPLSVDRCKRWHIVLVGVLILATCLMLIYSHETHMRVLVVPFTFIPAIIAGLFFGRRAYPLLALLVAVEVASHLMFEGTGGIKAHLLDFLAYTAVAVIVVEALHSRRVLRRKYTFLDLVLNQTLEGIAISDENLKCIYVNNAFAAMHGYESRELIGKHISIFHNAAQMPAVDEANRKLEREREFLGELWHARRDGTVFPALMHNSRLKDADGRMIGMIATLRDMTDIKRAEEALIKSERLYQSLAEAAHDYIFIINPDFTVRYVNDHGTQGLHRPKNEIIGKPVWELFPPQDADRFKHALGEVFATGVPRFTEETVTFPHGEMWLHTSLVPLKNETGEVESILGISRDVTVRKRAEEALRASEERYRKLVELSPDTIAVHDGEKVLFINATGAKLLGARTPEEVIGKPVMELVHPDSRALVRARVERMLRENIRLPFVEERFVRFDGSVIETEAASMPLVYQGMRAIQSVIRDVGARKNAERETVELRRQIDLILASTKTNIDIIDRDFRLRYVDHEWRKIYGDPAGRTCYEYFMGRKSACPDCTIPDALATKKTAVSEHILPREGNRIIQVTTLPFQDATGEWLVAEVNVDITQRKRADEALRGSEARYKSLFEDSPISLWEEDFSEVKRYLEDLRAKGATDMRAHLEAHPEDVAACAGRVKILEVNRATIEMYNAKSRNDFNGNLADLFVPESFATFREGLVALMEGREVFAGEAVTRTFDGTRKDISIRWAMKPGAEALADKVLVSIEDITEFKRLEREVRAALNYKSDFMATMSHELKTPLSVIIGSADLVLHDAELNLTEQRRKNMEGVLRSADKLLYLINNILEMAKIESGKVGMNVSEVSLKKTIASCAEWCAPLVEAAEHITLVQSVDDDVPSIITDEEKLTHVIANLLGNALKFTRQGSITISARRARENTKAVEIEVRDTGIGMPRENLGAIFERFRQIAPPTAQGKTGVGLGLSIVKAYLEMLGGTIRVESEEGVGSVFTVTLPIKVEKNTAK